MMTSELQIFPNLITISDAFRGILLDAYGVFWGGNLVGLLPGTKETMKELVAQGKIVGILSNSTQLAAKEVEKLQAQGLIEGQHFHFLMTSGEMTKQIFSKGILPFKTPRKKYWLFGENHPKFSSSHLLFQEFAYRQTHNLDEADFIALSVPHINGEDQTDPSLFHEKVEEIKASGLPMVCSNPDRFAHEGNPPRLVVRQGSIAAMYEDLGGKVYYIGKPFPTIFSIVMETFSHFSIVHPQDVLMVGDTPETDIRGANGFGMHSALVMQTGITSERISQKGLSRTLKELPKKDYPNFFIQRMAE